MPQTETKLPTAKEVLDTIKVITDDYAEKKQPELGAVILQEIDGRYFLLTPKSIMEITYGEYQDYKQMLERNNN